MTVKPIFKNRSELKTAGRQSKFSMRRTIPTGKRTLNLQIARAYLAASDPKMMTRTWEEVMREIIILKAKKKAQPFAAGTSP